MLARREVGRPGGMYTNTLMVGHPARPLLTYYEPVNNTLRAAACADSLCTSVSTSIIGAGGRSHSAVVGRQGLPWITYCQENPSTGRHAVVITLCSDITCSAAVPPPAYRTSVLDSDGCSLYTAITLSAEGLPLITYYRRGDSDGDGSTWFAACRNKYCTESVHHPLRQVGDPAGFINGPYASIGLRAGFPVISFARRVQDTKGAVPVLGACSDPLCEQPLILTSLVGKSLPAHRQNTDARYTAIAIFNSTVSVLFFASVSETAFISTVNCGLSGHCTLQRVAVVDDRIGPVYGEFPRGGLSPFDGDSPTFPYYRQVSKSEGVLMLATCLTRECSDVHLERLAVGGCGFGRDASIAFDSVSGLAYVTFMDYSADGSQRAADVAILRRSTNNSALYPSGSNNLRKFADIC